VKRFLAWLFSVASLALVLAFLVLSMGVVQVPRSYIPWEPLDLRDEPNFLTGFKQARLERRPDECLAVLRSSFVQHTPVPDQVTGDRCGFAGAVRISRSRVSFGSEVVATCPLAVAWALFETTCSVLRPGAILARM
jgi:hypothetical protein